MDHCLECNKELEGRLNKKFCSTKCKNTYHNRKYRESDEPIVVINKILKHNRQILKQYHNTFKFNPIHKEIIEANPINENYYTHHFENKRGEVYTFCYDYGWIKTDQDHYKIVKVE